MSWNAENYLAHSAKGTSWKKDDHKYVKKVGNKYYYKDDYDRMIRKKKADDAIVRNAKFAQYEWEKGKYKDQNETSFDTPYFDRSNPGSSKMLNDNIIDSTHGKWDGAAYGTPQNHVVRAKNEVKNIEKEQEYADKNRSWQAKAEMKILTIGDSIITAGKSLLKKLGIQV